MTWLELGMMDRLLYVGTPSCSGSVIYHEDVWQRTRHIGGVESSAGEIRERMFSVAPSIGGVCDHCTLYRPDSNSTRTMGLIFERTGVNIMDQ